LEVKCGGSRFIELNPYKSILEVAAAAFCFIPSHTERRQKVYKTPDNTLFFDFYQKICYNIYVR
jgi:hypothetical protein